MAPEYNMSCSQAIRCLRAELEIALLESMSEGGDEAGQRSNPPASKAFVQQLPAEALTTDRLHELGGDVQCSICMCGHLHASCSSMICTTSTDISAIASIRLPIIMLAGMDAAFVIVCVYRHFGRASWPCCTSRDSWLHGIFSADASALS